MEGKFLVTTNQWFMAPDGQMYQSVWGNVQIVSDSILGVKTNARSANWYAKIGPDDSFIIVAGCQIFYAVKCEQRPFDGPCLMDERVDGTNVNYETRTRIFFTE